MKIFIVANEGQQKELESINSVEKDSYIISNNLPETVDLKIYDLFLILKDYNEINIEIFEKKDVIINEVSQTLHELNLPENFHRINAWPGFLQRKTWEIVSNTPEKIKDVLAIFNRKIFSVKDEPGFVSARVISMIINEAFYAVGEQISTKEEIDLAMKLGTNYPYGPFEWAEKIGIENIIKLLEKLAEKEERYIPADALLNFSINQKNFG